MFKVDGVAPTPRELRKLCAEARAAGREGFPTCDGADERGVCRGHEAGS